MTPPAPPPATSTAATTRKHRAQVTSRDPRWSAVVNRDRSADSRFVYSVSTTGVYCRPSCAARRARPEHVSFHDSCMDAEQAGFRPCKRCRPHTISPAQAQADLVAETCRRLDADGPIPSLRTLARSAGLSPSRLHQLFSTATGLTPRRYAALARGRRLEDELGRPGTITTAIYGAGFASSAVFYRAAAARLGMTPSAYRSGGEEETIRYCLARYSLGALLVAASARGLCAVNLAARSRGLVTALQLRFPRATLIAGDADFGRLVAQVIALIEDASASPELPLDLQGTIFQQRVWQALRRIPCGATASYAEIARQIGMPQGARAVARACAANDLAVVIPCHRVVRSSGALAGYRWGLPRKRILLAREARDVTPSPPHRGSTPGG